MQQYLDLLRLILERGAFKSDRTGVGTRSVFGSQLRFDLNDGFPLLTTKKLHIKSIAYELLWFLRGESNVKFLRDHGVSIWDEWADDAENWVRCTASNGAVGRPPTAGTSTSFREVVDQIRTNPDSRRMIVSAWNVGEIEQMRLPPCHLLFQFYVAEGRLSCQMYQRSADVFLGVPFNIASYALLTSMVAHVTGLQPGEFILDPGRRAPVPESPRTGAIAIDAATPTPADAAVEPSGAFAVRVLL